MTAVAVALLAAAPVAHAGQSPGPTATVAVPPVRDVEARSYATRPESEPPRYTRPLSRTGLPGTGDIDWLDVGLDYRLRYEYRYRDLRRPAQDIDEPLLLRTRAFIALRDVIDPLRVTVELEDARRYGSQYALDTRDVNVIDRLFGFARPWSSSDYFQMDNLNTPKVVVELAPARGLLIDAAYAAYRLASATDGWSGAALRDPTGESGRDLGQEFNIRVRFPIAPRLAANAGYASFAPGRFARVQGKGETSHFVYVELSVNAFR